MFKGIRAQLFFGFGALVLVINLFYFRVTTLFVDVTEEVVAHYVLEKEASLLSPEIAQVLREDDAQAQFQTEGIFILQREALFRFSEVSQSLHDERLYTFGHEGEKGYAYALSATPESSSEWLVLNTQNGGTLSYFSSVFSVFLISISLAVILLTVLSTWFIAAKLSAPIIALTYKVGSQQAEKPCSISEASRQDEIGQLALTFENTFQALQHAWRREHNFASDVSHELRTPIALIRNTLVLNENGVMSEDDKQVLSQSTDALQNTVEVLLALARKENLVFKPWPLLPFIERATLALYGSASTTDFNIDVQIDKNMVVTGNDHLIALLLQNLINNGFYHGGAGGMRIYAEEQRVIFENAITTSSSQAYQGLGHGQYLVRRIAEVMGWSVSVNSTATLYGVTVQPAFPEAR